ncbi:MAG: acyloxyacyl hydrolase [Bacteroidia bacterium]|nr:acyloxyacyl hydrolase [Bacteroidia bacterium]
MRQVVILFILFSYPFGALHAQKGFKKSLSFDYGRGLTLKHTPKLNFDQSGGSQDLRLDLAFQTNGQTPWHKFYRKPRIGLGMMYLDYGNPDVLGQSYAIYGFIDQAYLRTSKFSIWGRFDHGLSWQTKIFHPTENPINNAIGSRLNLHASLGLRIEYLLNPSLSIRLGGYFVHQSNSRITVPNLGLNTVKALGGLSYHFQGDEKNVVDIDHSDFDLPKWQFVPKVGLGIKEDFAFNGPKYPIYILSFQMARNVKRKRRYLFGLESTWDLSNQAFKRDQEFNGPDVAFQTFLPSISIGHEYLFGRIGLLTQANIYLRNTFSRKNFWTSRLGSNIYLKSNFIDPDHNLFVGVYIRTHVFVADFLEFGMGYQF